MPGESALSRLATITALVVSCLPAFAAEQDAMQEQSWPPGIELPQDEGRELLVTACTRCHDLAGLPAYSKYWNRQRWMSMLETMVSNGAKLDRTEMEVVADYLGRHFGPGN